MNQCKEIQAQVSFYLDDELQGRERAALEAHLVDCDTCRRLFDSERNFLDAVRGSQPLYLAQPELLAKIENLLADRPQPHAVSPEFRRRVIWSLLKSGLTGPSSGASRRLVAAVAVFVLSVVIGLWIVDKYREKAPNPPSEFALMAVDTHQRHLRNQLPLEIASDMPEQISQWFAGKVPFSLKLPNYQESSGQEKLYNLEGARLVGYKNDYAAYVAYKMRRQPISLVVTSEAVAQPSGGEEIVSKGLTFHYDSIQGLKVITWSDRGLTYALVSDLEERGQQSCIVCHQGTKDQDFIERLKPRQVSKLLQIEPQSPRHP